MTPFYDAIVIGGGFYGCVIAEALSKRLNKVLVLEKEDDLFQRASYVNQARIHAGYHYPRSLQTAASSAHNISFFRDAFRECVDDSFTKIYAIAATGSKVDARYFQRFCQQLRLPLKPAPRNITRLFSPRFISAAFVCEEFAFDARALHKFLKRRLDAAGVEVALGSRAVRINAAPRQGSLLNIVEKGGGERELRADWVFNTTYANLSRIAGLSAQSGHYLRHQVAEICLVAPPDELKNYGITVMDGPFFSIMPFPAEQTHSLSHVRYTPHYTWSEAETPENEPDKILSDHAKISRFDWMKRDAARYLPVLEAMTYQKSLFDIKTTLTDTQIDDARPITISRDPSNPQVFSILGGKLDNVFDVLKVIGKTLNVNEE